MAIVIKQPMNGISLNFIPGFFYISCELISGVLFSYFHAKQELSKIYISLILTNGY